MNYKHLTRIFTLALFLLPLSTSASSYSQTLCSGDSGTAVSNLQQFLVNDGFNTSVTGYFGNQTQSALMSFQSSEAIHPTGCTGPITRSHINTINGAHPAWTTTLSNDTGYTNVSGSQVHSPAYSTGGTPAGASALCGDGTYSFSMHRRGTCSHHGGVASWL